LRDYLDAESTVKSTTYYHYSRLATSGRVHEGNEHSSHSKLPLSDGASEDRFGTWRDESPPPSVICPFLPLLVRLSPIHLCFS